VSGQKLLKDKAYAGSTAHGKSPLRLNYTESMFSDLSQVVRAGSTAHIQNYLRLIANGHLL
jgi:hypothetical protein